jgi:hypothetical protein
LLGYLEEGLKGKWRMCLVKISLDLEEKGTVFAV